MASRHWHHDDAPKGGPYFTPPGSAPASGRACDLPYCHATPDGWCWHGEDALTAIRLANRDSGNFNATAQERSGPMHVDVWYNTTFHGMGLPFGPTDEPETFCHVLTDEVPGAETVFDTAELIWRAMNVVNGDELPVQLRVRSMSVGDVVVIDGVAVRAANVGFELIDWPEEAEPEVETRGEHRLFREGRNASQNPR